MFTNRPVLNTTPVICSRAAQLFEIGVLAEEKSGRDKLFIHRKYMSLLASDGHTFEPYAGAAAPRSKRLQRR